MNLDNESKKWLKLAVEGSGIKIEESEIFTGLFTKNYRKDPLCALQIGIAILLDKPIALLVLDNEEVPETLKKIAFAIEYVQSQDPDEMHAAMKRVMDKAP